MMKKTIAAGTIALTLAGAGLALAQHGTRRAKTRGLRPSAEDVAAFTDARIAGLKAGLKLTAEQEKNWPAVETAIRDLAKERADRMKARRPHGGRRERGAAATMRSSPAPDAIARLRQGADRHDHARGGLKKLADAAEPLYKSLDDGQKRRFAVLLRMGGRPGGGHGHWQRRADNAR